MRRQPWIGAWLIIALVIYAGPGSAELIKAKSGSSTDIQAAVDLAKTGDIIAIPAGTRWETTARQATTPLWL